MRDDSGVVVLGTGSAPREFLRADDRASAIPHLIKVYDGEQPVNVGFGAALTIRELAELVRDVTGYAGRVVFDATRPDGTPRRLLDVQRVKALGWSPRIDRRECVRATCE